MSEELSLNKFAFALGICMGALSDKTVRAELMHRGVSAEDLTMFRGCAGNISKAFYVKEESRG